MFVPISKLRRAALGGFIGAAGLSSSLAAQQAPRADLRFDVRPWPEVTLLAVAGIAALVPELSKGSLPHARCGPCDPSGLWGIDRAVIGPLNRDASRISDVGLLGTVTAAGLLTWGQRSGEGGDLQRDDLVVLAQALTAAGALMEWLKVLASRPRPVLYASDSTAYGVADNGLSFPSGHASQTFAAAAAYASILHRRGTLDRHRTEIVALFSLAAATGALRVMAHKHFPTDVLAGAALGTAVGWLVPAIHATR
jgi:membrane-associated phospholipid phosphatase